MGMWTFMKCVYIHDFAFFQLTSRYSIMNFATIYTINSIRTMEIAYKC